MDSDKHLVEIARQEKKLRDDEEKLSVLRRQLEYWEERVATQWSNLANYKYRVEIEEKKESLFNRYTIDDHSSLLSFFRKDRPRP